jgi:hypothetical protein
MQAPAREIRDYNNDNDKTCFVTEDLQHVLVVKLIVDVHFMVRFEVLLQKQWLLGNKMQFVNL